MVGVDLADVPRRSRWPARLDVLQSATGLALALFVAVHLLLDSAILLGPRAADFVARLFEGEPLLGAPYPGLVRLFALGVLGLVVAHAAIALGRLPHDYRRQRAYRRHSAAMRHADTRLWGWQALTGFALLILVGAHLYLPITQPEDIGAIPSARRVTGEGAWAFYALLLPVVVFHAAAGIYRLALKWDVLRLAARRGGRQRLRIALWGAIAVYLALGLAALLAYGRLGHALSG